MKNLYILGAGGFAREVCQLAHKINYKVLGFIDRKGNSTINFANEKIPILSEKEFINSNLNKTEIYLAMGVGEPQLINKLSLQFSDFNFPNLIDPRATCDLTLNKLGIGNIVTAGTIFTNMISMGNFNVINLSSTIGHDVIIGDCNVINPSVSISGGVKIGNSNLIGVGATILQYKNIGNNSIVGAASLVTKDVDNNVTVIGVPAKNI